MLINRDDSNINMLRKQREDLERIIEKYITLKIKRELPVRVCVCVFQEGPEDLENSWGTINVCTGTYPFYFHMLYSIECKSVLILWNSIGNLKNLSGPERETRSD